LLTIQRGKGRDMGEKMGADYSSRKGLELYRATEDGRWKSRQKKKPNEKTKKGVKGGGEEDAVAYERLVCRGRRRKSRKGVWGSTEGRPTVKWRAYRVNTTRRLHNSRNVVTVPWKCSYETG